MADTTVPTPTVNSGTGYKEILAGAPQILNNPAFVLHQSFAFDGTNENFTCNSGFDTVWNNAITGSNKQFTIAIWFKKTTTGTTTLFLNRDNSSGSIRQFVVFISSTNKITANFYTNSTNFISTPQTTTFTDTASFHLLLVTYDGTLAVTSRVAFYLDGASLGATTTQTGTFTTINNITSPSIEIGGRSSAASYLPGNVHNIGLFNKVLSGSERTEIYNTGKTFDWRTHSANANLVSYLHAGNITAYGGTNWTWQDLIIGGTAVATSANMESADLETSAPPST